MNKCTWTDNGTSGGYRWFGYWCQGKVGQRCIQLSQVVVNNFKYCPFCGKKLECKNERS